MINKAILALRSIKNIHTLVMDFLGLSRGEIIYHLWNGNVFIARAGTTDYAEIIINNADSEYPSNLYPKNSSPVILDVGANIGETALFICQKLKKNGPTIYAFEPNTKNFKYLVKNIKLNKAKTIIPFKLALSGKTGTSRLNFEGSDYDGGFVGDTKLKQTSDSEIIKTITLDDFCKKNKIKYIDLLKMDIEGSEYEVFEKSRDFIKKHVKGIFVELHNLNKKNNYLNFKKSVSKMGFAIEADIMNRTLYLRNKSFI